MRIRWAAALLILACSGQGQGSRFGWQQLFDGHDLNGWQHIGAGRFTVERGLLKTEGGLGLLYWTGGQVGDCEIRITYRMEGANDHSGVFIRIPGEPASLRAAVDGGYEVDIGGSAAGALRSFTKPLAVAENAGRRWNSMTIRLQGRRTQVFINDVKVTDYTEGQPVAPKTLPDDPGRGLRPDAGWIGVENHGADETVFFQKIVLLKLGAIQPWMPDARIP